MANTTQQPIDIKDVKPGFYWTKERGCNWHNLILEVYGESPFLALRAWRLNDDEIIKVSPEDLFKLIPIPRPGK